MAGTVGPRYFDKYSMNTDGSNEYMKTGAVALGITPPFSVSFWFKTTDTDSITHMVGQDDAGGSERDWVVNWRGSSLRYVLFAFWSTGGTQSSVTSTANVYDDGEWHHCVCTWDGTTDADKIIMYIDGNEDNTATAGATTLRNNLDNNSNTFGIGGVPNGGGRFFQGNINEVALFNKELTQSEVTILHNDGNAYPTKALGATHNWRMGEGATWDGSNWTIPEIISGSASLTSTNMEEADRQEDTPSG